MNAFEGMKLFFLHKCYTQTSHVTMVFRMWLFTSLSSARTVTFQVIHSISLQIFSTLIFKTRLFPSVKMQVKVINHVQCLKSSFLLQERDPNIFLYFTLLSTSNDQKIVLVFYCFILMVFVGVYGWHVWPTCPCGNGGCQSQWALLHTGETSHRAMLSSSGHKRL